MLGCTGTGKITEYEFIWALGGREDSWDCRGPLLRLSFSSYRLMTLEQAINSQRATDVLWDGLALASSDRVTFALCGAHWMDLSYLAGLHGRLQGRRDWSAEGSALLKDICTSAGWDVKEIANMIVWRNLQCK